MKKLQLNGLQLSQSNLLSKDEKNQLTGGVLGGGILQYTCKYMICVQWHYCVVINGKPTCVSDGTHLPVPYPVDAV